MFRSSQQKSLTSLCSLLVGLTLVVGLVGPALATPPEDVPFWADILNRLNVIEGKVDNLQTDVDNLSGGGSLGPCDVPPVWGQTYATADRFVPVLGGAAFCDKATGLVWDGSPDPNPRINWQAAVDHCTSRTVGGQRSFHLPLIEQLASLLPLVTTDLNSATGDGPFSNVQSAFYWSATSFTNSPHAAWIVVLGNGAVFGASKDFATYYAWCVRGGQTYDGQDVLNAVAN